MDFKWEQSSYAGCMDACMRMVHTATRHSHEFSKAELTCTVDLRDSQIVAHAFNILTSY